MPAYLKTFDNVIIFPFAAEIEKIRKLGVEIQWLQLHSLGDKVSFICER